MRTIRIINDIVIYFCFCFLAGTGLMMEFSFVKGAGPQYVLSMGKKAWETGHFWVGVVAILAFILHFCLNSRFFKNVLKTRIVYILFVIIGFGGAILLAVWPTEKGEATAPAGHGQRCRAWHGQRRRAWHGQRRRNLQRAGLRAQFGSQIILFATPQIIIGGAKLGKTEFPRASQAKSLLYSFFILRGKIISPLFIHPLHTIKQSRILQKKRYLCSLKIVMSIIAQKIRL